MYGRSDQGIPEIMGLKHDIEILKAGMQREAIVPENGLGTEMFLFASTLMPVVNVDLLVFNEYREVLLSWREDAHCGTGWHVPGGCIRMKETFETRIQKTAQAELGTYVEFSASPIEVFEIFCDRERTHLDDQNERAHFITLVFACSTPKNYVIPACRQHEGKAGCLKWFQKLPENLLSVQQCYRDNWSSLMQKIWGNI